MTMEPYRERGEIGPDLGGLLWRRYYQVRAEKYGGQITVNDDTFRTGKGLPIRDPR
jgi:hypothetical protein